MRRSRLRPLRLAIPFLTCAPRQKKHHKLHKSIVDATGVVDGETTLTARQFSDVKARGVVFLGASSHSRACRSCTWSWYVCCHDRARALTVRAQSDCCQRIADSAESAKRALEPLQSWQELPKDPESDAKKLKTCV